jgi:hypothetical protein
MKNSFKNNKGISAVSLMITIVVIIIIAGYSLFFSRDTVIEAQVAKAYSEIQEMQDATKALSLDSSYAREYLAGYELEDISDMNERVGNKLREGKQYYYIGYADESVTDVMKQSLNEVLGVRNIEGSYIISVGDIGEIDVFLVDGININDKFCYTYEEIHKEYVNVTQK